MGKDNNIENLSLEEIEGVFGGLSYVGAYAIACGIGALAIAAFQAGYEVGKDLAS
ncbi:MAG: hypothetical protein RLZZ427_493 [Pseudomonadota bacterium]|jgi:hypothetical protein